jgi:MFS family permease
MAILVGVMLALALLPYGASVWVVTAIVTVQGLAAGVSLAPLHRVSMIRIAPEQTGIAAGLYSMTRFTGTLLGPVIGGVMLQYGLDTFALPVTAYQLVFGLIAGVTVLGIISGWGLLE